jgi:hypothetical protein
MGMEAHHSVEFTGVELAAPVEKATIGLVEKASRRLMSTVEGEKDGWRSSGATKREDGSQSSAVKSATVVRLRWSMPWWCGHDAARCSNAGTATCSLYCMSQHCEHGGDMRTETTEVRKVRAEFF